MLAPLFHHGLELAERRFAETVTEMLMRQSFFDTVDVVHHRSTKPFGLFAVPWSGAIVQESLALPAVI